MATTSLGGGPAALADPYRLWLFGLFLLWAALLFGGFALGGVWGSADVAAGASRIPTWARMESSVVLVIAAWLFFAAAGRTPIERYGFLIAIGMTLGLLGDLFNAELIPFPNATMGGILAFGLGHIAYIAGFLWLRRVLGLDDARAWWMAVLLWQVVGLIGWWWVVYRAGDVGALHWAALPYSLLLAGTAGCATALAMQDRRFLFLGLGAALFLLSDLILAWRLFRGAFPFAGDAVWLTYGPGQMLIVYSIGSALSAERARAGG